MPPFVLPIETAQRLYCWNEHVEEFKTQIRAKALILAIRSLLCVALTAPPAFAQNPTSAKPSASPVERGLDLAAMGQCEEAIPLLKQIAPNSDTQLQYKAELAIVRCAIKRRDGRETVTTLLALKHDFPEDPEVLYLTAQVFLQIAETASTDLARVAPHSYQVQKLQAESLESQSKWADAAAIYRKILEANPNLPGIHLKLGVATLSQPELAGRKEQAKKEFEQELANDPTSATAQFWLGEIARTSGDPDEALGHFTAATKLDARLWPAYLGLGMALNSVARYADAIGPLEQYTAALPSDETGHYQLAISYRHTGRQQDAEREMATHHQITATKEAAAAARMDGTSDSNH
jgi:tetratricopeptide (TPR) repeat protein